MTGKSKRKTFFNLLCAATSNASAQKRRAPARQDVGAHAPLAQARTICNYIGHSIWKSLGTPIRPRNKPIKITQMNLFYVIACQ